MEKIVEVPVERVQYIKKPVEKIVKNTYDIVKENIIY